MAPQTKLDRLIDMLAQEGNTRPLAGNLQALNASLANAAPDARARIKSDMLATAYSFDHKDAHLIADELSQTLACL